jgi:hypothetical protein
VLLAPYPNNPNTLESCNVKTDFQVVLQGDSPARVLVRGAANGVRYADA